MTDRTDPLDADASDALRAQLQVEPLDEVTRARLVRDALAAAPAKVERSHRPVRWLAAAAAVAAVIAVGASVLVRSSDAPQTTASAPAAKSANERDTSQELSGDAEEFDRGSGAPSSERATAAPSAPDLYSQTAIPSLGKLGEVGRAKELRAAVNAAKSRGQFVATCPTPTAAAGGEGGVLISGGTGTVDGEPASIYVIKVLDAGKVAVAVIDADCRTAVITRF